MVTVRSTSFEIFRIWIELHIILKRFEGVIRRRWSKRSRQQRAAILKEAWPCPMPTTSRPEFASVRRGCSKHSKRLDKATQREIHLWPFVNLESLVAADTLTVYLNARGRHLPWRFVHTDLSTAHTETPAANSSVDKYRLRVIACSTPKSYGAPILAKSDQRQPGYATIKAAKVALHPYKAALAFEIQIRILSFLLKCGRIILRDHTLATLTITPSITLSSIVAIPELVCPMTGLAAIAPYQPPGGLNFARLAGLLRSRTEESADHLWALREDPSYFKQHLRDWAEHNSSNVLDQDRQPHGCIKMSYFWNCAASRMICHAYSDYLLWNSATTYCRKLWQEVDECGHEGGDSATRYFFRLFDAHMQSFLQYPLFELSRGLGASPPLRTGYLRPRDVCSPSLSELSIRPHQMGRREKRLDTLFKCLLRYDQHKLHGLSGIVEEIQRTINVERDRVLITSWVADRFSDVALIVEVLRQIDVLQPWAELYRGGTNDIDELMEEEPYCCIALDEEALSNAISDCRDTYGPLARKVLALGYPHDKRPAQKTITEMNMAEAALDRLWAAFDKRLKNETGSMWKYLSRPLASTGRKLQRTPRWEEHPCYEALTPDDLSSRHVVKPVTYGSTLLTDIDPNGRHARPTRAALMGHTPIRADKTKTKGVATPVAVTPTNKECSHPSSTTDHMSLDRFQSQFRLSKRALKVFTIIFESSHHLPMASDVVWHELLYAMGSMGFATEKLYGSSWRFTPPDTLEDVRDEKSKASRPKLQPILCHEPHPSSKLRYWEAKRLGRRLGRHYGWTGDMFAVK